MKLYHISKQNFNNFLFVEPFCMDTRYGQGAMVYFAPTIKDCQYLTDNDTDYKYIYEVEIDDRLLFKKYPMNPHAEIVVTHETISHMAFDILEFDSEDYHIVVKMLDEVCEGKPVTNNKFFKILKKEFIKKEEK